MSVDELEVFVNTEESVHSLAPSDVQALRSFAEEHPNATVALVATPCMSFCSDPERGVGRNARTVESLFSVVGLSYKTRVMRDYFHYSGADSRPNVDLLTPTTSDISGGDPISIALSDFFSVSRPQDLVVSFRYTPDTGDRGFGEIVAGMVDGDRTYLSVILPEMPRSGDGVVEIAVNQLLRSPYERVSTATAPFRFTSPEDTAVIDFSPSAFYTEGGPREITFVLERSIEPETVVGSRFGRMFQAATEIEDESEDDETHTYSLTLPEILKKGTYELPIEVDGSPLLDGLIISVSVPPRGEARVEYIEPSSGPQTGHTEVRVLATNFMHVEDEAGISCRLHGTPHSFPIASVFSTISFGTLRDVAVISFWTPKVAVPGLRKISCGNTTTVATFDFLFESSRPVVLDVNPKVA